MSEKKSLIVANWKMNPESYAQAEDLFVAIKDGVRSFSKVAVVIAPPTLYLGEIASLYSGNRIAFGAQDAFWERKGSYTGEVSPTMLKDSGAEYVIVGHSERREGGESDDGINKKVQAVTKAGLTAILCVGESERDHNGAHLNFLKQQITSALHGIAKSVLSRVIIAYEPVWAIGKSEEEAMKPTELHETVLFIKKIIGQLYGTKSAHGMRVLYGGSTGVGNTEALLTEGEVDGLLVGRASLHAKDFIEMVRIAHVCA